jgi:surface antigen bspA-like|nr:MAG TPA: leucine rich repeat protein [Caudoviricetes sp.]
MSDIFEGKRLYGRRSGGNTDKTLEVMLGRLTGNYSLSYPTEVVTVPDTVKRIPREMFERSYGIRRLVLNNNIERVDSLTFNGSSIRELEINNNKPIITFDANNGAFSMAAQIKRVYIGADYTATAKYETHNNNMVLYRREPAGKTLLFVSDDFSGVFTMDTATKTIAPYAFTGRNSNITGIVFNNSLNRIEMHAFHSCSKVKNFTLPRSVIKIGLYAFWYCTGMETITIPKETVSIDSHQLFIEAKSLKFIYTDKGNGAALQAKLSNARLPVGYQIVEKENLYN